ncbi:MAG TPA: alpha/beta hydrolase [Bacillota bacterium]|nr:alpha/beta hydrolase [Bacillota bacterium]
MFRLNKFYWIGLCAIVIVAFIITYIPKETKSEQSSINPTVFVHGYKGTYNSFGNMLNRFENKYNWGHKALVYQIAKDGTIQVKKGHRKNNDEPIFIQVIFEDNRASFADSAGYLSTVMKHLKENYQIDSINLVGHSMGGIVALKFIDEQLDDSDSYPSVQKYVAIGSPFDGIYKESYFEVHKDAGAIDLMPNSDALKSLYANEAAFPESIEVLSIASTGDVIAAPKSVSALKNIIPDTQLKNILIENENLGHSDLHESEKVDRLIHTFLYAEE